MTNFPTILTGFAANAEAATVGTLRELANDDAAPVTPEPAPEFPRFEEGAVYSTRSICDHDCIFRWIVVRRTEKSVWLQSVGGPDLKPYGDVTRRSITTSYDGTSELVYPSGKYSMCPTITPEKKEVI